MRNNYQQSQDSITRISRSKSRNQMSIVTKLREKESGWDGRFHLDQIPQYNYHNQPHSQYLKNKFRIPNRKNDPSRAKRLHQPSLEKNKVSNKPNPKKNQEKWKQAITKAYADLKSLWFQKGIPECHMEVMTKLFNRENNTMKILQDIKHEFSEISKETSQIQKIISSIATRQSCLEKIQQLYPELDNDISTNKSKVGKMFEQKISHLRILTIHCIECIFQWKQLLQSMGPRSLRVKYIHNGKLYTIKVKEDYKKIIQSKFNEVYKFETNKVDAFFLNYTYDGKKISNVSKNLVKRIRLCQIMLNEEEDNEQEIKRTPLMEKLKSPPRNITENRDKSMPPRGKTPVVLPWTKVPLEYGQFADYFTTLLSKSQFGSSFLPVIEMSRYDEYTILRYTQTQEQIVIGVEKNSSQRKIIVLGLKSNYQGFEAVLKSFCQYIWEHDYCNEIRISLVHQKQVNSFAVDGELQKKLKLVGFRWVSINHSNQIRLTIYGMKRPLNTVAHKTSRRTQAYPVIIEHLVNLNLSQVHEKKQPSRSFPSVLDLIQFISENKKQTFQQICRRDQFSHALSCLRKIQEYLRKQAERQGLKQDFQTTFTYSGLRSFEAQNQEKLQKIFRNVQIPSNKSKAPSTLSLLNTSFKFNHITIHDGKYTKFFPAKDSEILIVQSNYPIYLLQSDEQNINFFVIQVSQGFSMDSIENIFNSMGQQSSFIDEFWLPTFFKSEDYTDEQGLLNTELISTNYRNSLGSLSRKSKVRTKIIKAPFVYGMINKKFLQILQIPFYCTLVRKQDLI